MLALFKRQRGDTIVEVLISMSVVSLVLTGAFVSAQGSLTGTRRSQERVEALKTAEFDVEKLRSLATSSPDSVLFNTGNSGQFCLDKTGAPHLLVSALPELESDGFTSAVYYQSGGGPNANDSCPRIPSSGVTYYPSIIRDSSNQNLFTAHVRWDRAGGGPKQEVTLTYRVYP